jgi:hypothetical protein
VSVVVGIDVSTFAVDMVRLDLETDAAGWHHYEAIGPHALDRARSFCLPGSLPTRASAWWDDVALVALERPAGVSRRVVSDLMLVLGVVIAHIPPSISVWQLVPSEWRKACGLPGNASKGHVRAWSIHQLAWAHGKIGDADTARGPMHGLIYPGWIEKWPQDAHDAHAIAYAARAINATGHPAGA